MNADTLLLRALKGAPLSCLLALRHGGRLGTADLEAITGYERVAIRKALQTLASLGLVVTTQRYHGWQLTVDTVQLPLFIPAQLETFEGAKNTLEGVKSTLPLLGSGGGFLESEVTEGLINTTTTTAWEGAKNTLEGVKSTLPPKSAPRRSQPGDNSVDNSGADPETARLAEILVDRLLCKRIRALAAIADARQKGAEPAEIEIEILCWLGWLNAPETNTKSLNNPGYFVAKKIAEREAAPDDEYVVAWSDDDRRIQALRYKLEDSEE